MRGRNERDKLDSSFDGDSVELIVDQRMILVGMECHQWPQAAVPRQQLAFKVDRVWIFRQTTREPAEHRT